MSSDQLTELVEGLRAALEAAKAAEKAKDYPFALGILQGRMEWAVQQLERSQR